MTNILVLYASQKGSTQEVAKFILETLQQQGFNVELANAKNFSVKRTDYDAIIVGSGIYAGLLQPELVAIIRHLPPELAKTPIWGFALCLRILEDGGEEHIREHYLPHKTFAKLNLQEFRFFAGKLHDLTVSERVILSERYDGNYGTIPGDYRDWDAIKRYVQEIMKSLTPIKT